MANGTTKLQEQIDRLEEATAAGKEMTRELHAATKDARSVIKELAEQAEAVCVVANTKADDVLAQALEIQVKRIPDLFKNLVETAEKRIEKRFADLEHIFLDESDSNGHPSMSRIAEAVAVFHQLVRSDPRRYAR